MRDDKKLLGTDKEKTLLSPVSDYYGGLGKRCVETGLSVDLFLLPNQYSDVATLGELCRKTAGQIYKYDFFMADAHGQRLCDDLGYAVENTVAFDGVMKVRTSTGIRAVDYLGNFSKFFVVFRSLYLNLYTGFTKFSFKIQKIALLSVYILNLNIKYINKYNI